MQSFMERFPFIHVLIALVALHKRYARNFKTLKYTGSLGLENVEH